MSTNLKGKGSGDVTEIDHVESALKITIYNETNIINQTNVLLIFVAGKLITACWKRKVINTFSIQVQKPCNHCDKNGEGENKTSVHRIFCQKDVIEENPNLRGSDKVNPKSQTFRRWHKTRISRNIPTDWLFTDWLCLEWENSN